jgi:hypothetical protein
MTIGSAASLPGLEPAAALPSFRPPEARKRARGEQPMPEDSESGSEIRYPTAPESVSWPRVFPQL